MKYDLLRIIKTYGVLPQLKYFQSEVFELNEAIINHENKNPIVKAIDSLNKMSCSVSNKEYEISSIKSIKEELADCYVMLKQFQHYYEISDEDIEEVMKYKVDRQLKRMEEE